MKRVFVYIVLFFQIVVTLSGLCGLQGLQTDVIQAAEGSFNLPQALDRMVKIYGSGGLAGFDNYQTGFFISEDGDILTAASSVLDEEPIICLLNNGLRFEAVIVGMDPVRELAVLKIETKGQPFWKLSPQASLPQPGDSVFALSNLYGTAVGSEPVSVQRGCVSAITLLQARRGAFIAGYKGPVIIVDAITNNPGAAGGALLAPDGRLYGIIGKQLRSTEQQIWINYVLPESEAARAIEKIQSGQGKIAYSADSSSEERLPDLYWTTDLLGIRLVPNVLPQTLPFVDSVALASSGVPASPVTPASPAPLPDNASNDSASFMPDDLILTVNGTVVRNIDQLNSALRRIDTADRLEILVKRGEELVFVALEAK